MSASLRELLFEARKKSEEVLDEGVGLWISSNTIALVDWNASILKIPDNITTPTNAIKILGMIQYGDLGSGTAQVFRSAAEPKYGPIMYYILAKLSKSKFIMSDRSVSKEARKVWAHFYHDEKVEKRVRPELRNRDGSLNKSRALGEFSGSSSTTIYLPLCYEYAPKDSRIMLKTLIAEHKIGMQDFVEQYLEQDPGQQNFEQYLIGSFLPKATDQFFKRKYVNSTDIYTDADNPTNDFATVDDEEGEGEGASSELPESIEDISTSFTGSVEFETSSGKPYLAKFENGNVYEVIYGELDVEYGGDGGGVIRADYGKLAITYNEGGDFIVHPEDSDVDVCTYTNGTGAISAQYEKGKLVFVKILAFGEKYLAFPGDNGEPDYSAEALYALKRADLPAMDNKTFTTVPSFK